MAVTYNPSMPTRLAAHLRGRTLLETPALNQGTACTLRERQAVGLDGFRRLSKPSKSSPSELTRPIFASPTTWNAIFTSDNCRTQTRFFSTGWF